MPQITPPIPAVPQVKDPALYDYLSQAHAVLVAGQSSNVPPNLPTSLTVTPLPGGNSIAFTRSNGITFNLYASSSPDRSQATQVNLGSAASYTDALGQGGVPRWYWVEALNQQGQSSGVTGPKTGTTLALTAPAPTPPTIPQSYARVFDTTIGRTRPVIPATDRGISGQPIAVVAPTS